MNLDLHQYQDYRQYLKDFYLYKKSLKTGYSYAHFSKAGHLNSPNYLALVIEGQRNLTDENIFQFAQALSLKGESLHVFEMLVRENQARTPLTKNYYKTKLKRAKKNVLRSQKSLPKGEVLLNDPLSIPVLIASHLRTDVQHAEFCLENFKLSEKRRTRLMSEALHSGLIIQKEGVWNMLHLALDPSDPTLKTKSQKELLKTQFQFSLKAMERDYQTQTSKFLSLSFSGSPLAVQETFDRIHRVLQKTSQDFDQIYQNEPAPEVIQVNCQIFPIKSVC